MYRKEAIQKTIAAMTLGKDVSALFPDVLKNIATHDLGQKKLVYLYLMYSSNYMSLTTGTTRKAILSYVFLLSILSFKYYFVRKVSNFRIQRIRIRLFEHLPYGLWDVFV